MGLSETMTTTNLNHIILTRFNLPSFGHESIVRAKEGWLRNRVELFNTYCLPSVKAQSCKNFRWIIYFDPESPAWLMDHIEQWKQSGFIVPIFRASVSRTQLISDIHSIVEQPTLPLITTNLDNDDGLANDFIARLQQVTCRQPRTALYLANGIIKSNGKTFLRRDLRNAFCSVRENGADPVTCWAAYHNRLGLEMQEEIVYGAPAWLQVIHGENVSNRVQGTLCSPTNHRKLFTGMLDDVNEPGLRELAKDLMVQRPKRLVREGLRGACKRAVFAIFGLQGLDKAKHFYARLVQKLHAAPRRSKNVANTHK